MTPTLNMPASSYEAFPDILACNAEYSGELSVPNSIFVKSLGTFNVESWSDVLSLMRSIFQNLEVTKAIVRLVPVDVMNMLGGKQITTKMLRHDPSMFVNLLPFNADNSVSSYIQSVGFLPFDVTRAVAKCSLILSQLGSLPKKGSSARSTGEGYLHLLSEVPCPSCIGNKKYGIPGMIGAGALGSTVAPDRYKGGT